MRKGNVNRKIIHGKPYYYLQYRENGKAISKSIGPKEACRYAYEIYVGEGYEELEGHRFHAKVSYGLDLLKTSWAYGQLKRRYLFRDLLKFQQGNYPGKIFVLYGLRRTGKSTLMMQAISELSMKDFAKAAYLTVIPGMEFHDLDEDLDFLSKRGFEYFYIDEATLLPDFISMSSVLPDYYGTKAHVVVSGTDSLGFRIAERQELYDRTIAAHTTYISYKEWNEVLGLEGIDTYIEYGGTMSYEGVDYRSGQLLSGAQASEYVDSAIAHNITHSLASYKGGGQFSALREIYEAGELLDVINRLVEDRNHQFAASTIQKAFKSQDYGSLKHLIHLPRNKDLLGHALDDIDEKRLNEALKKALNILSSEQRTVVPSKEAIMEIDAYLDALDVFKTIEEINIDSHFVTSKKALIQPGIRYAQAKELVRVLSEQPPFLALPEDIRAALMEKLYSDIRGRMMEEIVLYATSQSKEGTRKVISAVSEYDMVVRGDGYSDVYEIKHALHSDPSQVSHLVNPEMEKRFEQRFYPIRKRIVLYRGESKTIDGIEYQNVEDYLRSLS